MAIPDVMTAVLLTGHGGPEVLSYVDDVPVPQPGPDDVLLRVLAAGVNNTDINTRVGWYSKSVRAGTADLPETDVADDGGWSGEPLDFPRIQGADACGSIVAVGDAVDPSRIGERVLAATMQQWPAGGPYATITMGSEIDGAFAQYTVVRSSEAFRVVSEWSDVELGSMPCAWSTAENMIARSGLVRGERVLVTGASGGVGSAAVQLAKRRGVEVIAIAGESKADAVRAIGADEVIARGGGIVAALGSMSIDVVIDLVGGDAWPEHLEVLRRGGRYVSSGAIAGPLVELDLRTLYLKDLTLIGATYQSPQVFRDLIGYIERNEIRPLVHATFALRDIALAQAVFMEKSFVGKLVLIPPAST